MRTHYDADDGLLMDWQSPSLSQELYYSTAAAGPPSEIRSDRQLRAGPHGDGGAMTHRNGTPFLQADNSLPANPYLPQGLE